MSEPLETPEAPKRKPTVFERVLAALPKMHSAQTVQPLFTCSHRWPDGSTAWLACTWRYGSAGWGWYSTCQRCGLVAQCR